MKALQITILLCLVMMWSCDKADDNGALGGMWQLTEWKTVPDGNVVATKEDAIFYSVQLDLMKFSRNNDISTYHLARFSHKGDSLFVGKAYARPLEKGGFAIELSSKHMVLRSKEAVLKFRKY